MTVDKHECGKLHVTAVINSTNNESPIKRQINQISWPSSWFFLFLISTWIKNWKWDFFLCVRWFSGNLPEVIGSVSIVATWWCPPGPAECWLDAADWLMLRNLFKLGSAKRRAVTSYKSAVINAMHWALLSFTASNYFRFDEHSIGHLDESISHDWLI